MNNEQPCDKHDNTGEDTGPKTASTLDDFLTKTLYRAPDSMKETFGFLQLPPALPEDETIKLNGSWTDHLTGTRMASRVVAQLVSLWDKRPFGELEPGEEGQPKAKFGPRVGEPRVVTKRVLCVDPKLVENMRHLTESLGWVTDRAVGWPDAPATGRAYYILLGDNPRLTEVKNDKNETTELLFNDVGAQILDKHEWITAYLDFTALRPKINDTRTPAELLGVFLAMLERAQATESIRKLQAELDAAKKEAAYSPDAAYLDIIERVLTRGEKQENRTGIATYAIPSATITADLRLGFPLLQHKKVPMRSVAGELKWFLEGSTSKARAQELGTKVWNEWCSPQAPEIKALPADATKEQRHAAQLKADYMGEGVYGSQWRGYGYLEYSIDEVGASGVHQEGVDQVANILKALTTNPDDRRMVCMAWNPNKLNDCALPPCHMGWKVDVINGVLHLSWWQRSCDLFLGIPFNLASYALLLQLLADATGLVAGTVTGFLSNVHLYENHIHQAKYAYSRIHQLPLTQVKVETGVKSVADFWAWDPRAEGNLVVTGYDPLPAIKAEVAV